MDMHPGRASGIIGWILTGFVGGLLALLVGHFVPSLIPSQASSTRL